MDFGVNSGNGGWIQITNFTGYNFNYPILLNPNGGNVGIGTLTPSFTLDVNGSGRFNNSLLATFNSNTLGNLYTTGGNIGINTTNPNAILDIQKNGSAVINLQNTGTGASQLQLFSHFDSNNYFQTTGGQNTTRNLRLTTGGNVLIGATNIFSPVSMLTINGGNVITGVSQASIAFSYAPTPGFYHFIGSRHNGTVGSNQNSIDFYLYNSTGATGSSAPNFGNVNSMSVTATGVGIFNSNPSTTLDVNGGLRVVGTNIISSQGIHLQWNRSGGGGEARIINQPGGGNNNSIYLSTSSLTNVVTDLWQFTSNNIYNNIGGNIFIDSTVSGSQFIYGFNTPKNAGGSSIFQVYNNSTDRNIVFQVQSKGTTSGSDNVIITNNSTLGNILSCTGFNVGNSGTPDTSRQSMINMSRNATSSVQNAVSAELDLGSNAATINGISTLDFKLSSFPGTINNFGRSPDNVVMSLVGNGNVGINNSSPAYTLDVNGPVRRTVIHSTYTVSTAQSITVTQNIVINFGTLRTSTGNGVVNGTSLLTLNSGTFTNSSGAALVLQVS